MLAISNLFRELCGVSSNVSEEHVISEAEIARREKESSSHHRHNREEGKSISVCSWPSEAAQYSHQEVMSEDIKSQLLSVMEIGTKAYETLRKERFVEKSVRFSLTNHQTNLKTFLSIHKHEKENKGKSSGMKKEDAQIRCLIVLPVPEE